MTSVQNVKPKTARPLSKEAWSKRKDKGSWSYNKYRTWWSKNQGNQISKDLTPSSGMGTSSSTELASLFNTLYPDFSGSLLTPGQMRDQAGTAVSSMIDPVIQQLTDSIGARSKAGTNAITGYTNTAAERLGGLAGTVQQDYAGLKSQQSGVDEALRQFLGGRGDALQQDLQGLVGKVGGDPSTAASIGTLNQGIQGETAALGSASLSRLLGSEAADLGYARKLPGIARAQGAQSLGNFQGELNRMLDEGTGDIRAQVPGLVEGMFQRLLDRDMQQRGMKSSRGGAAASFLNAGMDRNLSATSLEATLRQRAQEMGIQLGNNIFDGMGSTSGADGLTARDLAGLQQEAGQWAVDTVTAFMAGDGITPARDATKIDLNKLRAQIAQGLRASYGGSLSETQILAIATQAVLAGTGRMPGSNVKPTAKTAAKPPRKGTKQPDPGGAGGAANPKPEWAGFSPADIYNPLGWK